MNKVNIIETEKDSIEGYLNVNIQQAKDLINGTIDDMVCETMDTYLYADRVSNIVLLCKKLSNLGTLTLKFINATKICKDVSRGNIGSQYLSGIVSESRSLFLESDIVEIISQIENIKINKMYNDNTSIIVVLQKNI